MSRSLLGSLMSLMSIWLQCFAALRLSPLPCHGQTWPLHSIRGSPQAASLRQCCRGVRHSASWLLPPNAASLTQGLFSSCRHISQEVHAHHFLLSCSPRLAMNNVLNASDQCASPGQTQFLSTSLPTVPFSFCTAGPTDTRLLVASCKDSRGSHLVDE